MVITHRFYYLTFHAVVIVTWHIHVQSLPITLRFRYSAFASPVQTMYSTVRLLGVSWLPLRFATSCKVMQLFWRIYLKQVIGETAHRQLA